MPKTKQRRKARRHHKVQSKLNRRRKSSANLCDSLSEIAQKISSHYRNKDGSSQLQFEIDRQTISHWKQGKRTYNSPPPPGKVNSFQWDSNQWLAWFKRYIFPRWKIGSSGSVAADDIFKLKQQDEVEALQQKQWERQKARGQFIGINEHNQIVMELGLLVNRALTEHGEKEFSQRLLQLVQSLNLPDDKRQSLVGSIKDMALKSVNALRERIKQLVLDSNRKEGSE